ncbi:hypothetical protein ACF1AE_19070 [Streptomyces sp. NPDC014986]|uniref:hypothetical protein n=1 Tax=Streptomyces sp. NPDC014986 TaxID=3364934 RepID=UPI0036F6D477
MGSVSPSHEGHRYPVEIISHCVWWYHRFPLSFREVDELMLERGTVVSCGTVPRWCAGFGQQYASALRRRQARPGATWHQDEVFITVSGERKYLWGAVVQDGGVRKQRIRLAENLLTAEYLPGTRHTAVPTTGRIAELRRRSRGRPRPAAVRPGPGPPAAQRADAALPELRTPPPDRPAGDDRTAPEHQLPTSRYDNGKR